MDHRILTHLYKDVLERGYIRGTLSLLRKDSDKSVKVMSAVDEYLDIIDESKGTKEVLSLLQSKFTQPRPHLSAGINIR